MTLDQLGERDGWRCWICGGDVDRAAPRSGPGSPSIDHVLPRARGGTSERGNLRLAHRWCNGQRGSRLPELDWPPELVAAQPAPLWPVVQRAVRRPGEWELVGLLPTAERADRARCWLAETLSSVLGGHWEVDVQPAGEASGSEVHLLRLRAAPAPVVARHRGNRRRPVRGPRR
ncbi:MAG: HNH endonuclease [Actinomycetota bacterium]|nr:HNH endonuclease [Actinomycetota bacterium]